MNKIVTLFRGSTKITIISAGILAVFIAGLLVAFSYLNTIIFDINESFSESYNDVQLVGDLISEIEVLNHWLDSYLLIQDDNGKYTSRRKVRESIARVASLRHILEDSSIEGYVGPLLTTAQEVILSSGSYSAQRYLEFMSIYEIIKFQLEHLQENILFHSNNDSQSNLLGIIYYMSVALIATGIGAFFLIMMFLLYRKANKRERQLRSHLSDVLNSMPSMLVSCDKDLFILDSNKQAADFTNIEGTSIAGHDIAEYFPMLTNVKDDVKSSLNKNSIYISDKIIHHHKDEINVYQLTAFPLTAKEIAHCIIKIDDITAKAKMEEILFQSEKMMSVGGLAAGIAHEINNPLVGIVQTAEVLENRLLKLLPANKRVAELLNVDFKIIKEYMTQRKVKVLLDNMRESGERISQIIHNMLRFARKDNNEPEIVNLKELCDKTLELASVEYNLKKKYDFRKIKIVKDFSGDFFEAKCKPGLLQQVILNILRNGAQAMYEYSREPQLEMRLFSDESYVHLHISDNGPGIPESVKKHIFEPFFTTKEKGIGTGIGLSVSHYIITEEMHGMLKIESKVGQGASFQLSLPLVKTPLEVG